ncbi:hydrogenase [Rhodoplanes elegans]|uniref:Hydrogenase n=1 Tax=Rhodoplanes elegans TaxID=29408 RepID=A0A327KFM0_9BRAD|nr:HypC/HybG/HupF family hydrogenase formation chaperone [Rhodoplanes elegans]MBK5961221.1 hydrogenase [Rhodoplanes elegans]RAI37589.1 hydrogenase [Rhodoplanes elegans]
MCIGLPMRIVTADAFSAMCERRGAVEPVSLLLVGPQPAGTPVLVHLGTAVRVLDEAEARQIDDALDALAAALDGRPFDHLFADLIGREPELPAHLAAAAAPEPSRPPDK